MTITALIKGVLIGEVQNGDTFETGSGHKVVYRNGVLSWVTSGGYIGSAVTLTEENMLETFTKVTDEKEVSFLEALPLIAEGTEVRLELESREYVVKDLEELDALIEKEYMWEIYNNAECYVKDKVEPKEIKGIAIHNGGYIEIKPTVTKKLDSKDAYDILYKYTIMNASVKDLAEEYDVSDRMIYYILDGTHWHDVHKQFHERYGEG
ncbi:hypothetical protein ABEU97_20440 [Priestia megaterium]